MKTPEEIKNGLRCHIRWFLDDCDMICKKCELNAGTSTLQAMRDALDYIQQLENQIGVLVEKVAQLEAARSAAETFRQERDVLLSDLKEAAKMDCSTCKYYAPDDGRCEKADFVCRDCSLGLKDCPCHTCEGASNWEWRGVVKTDDEAGD